MSTSLSLREARKIDVSAFAHGTNSPARLAAGSLSGAYVFLLPTAPQHHAPLRWLFNQPYLLLSLAALFWAGNVVLARYVGGHVPPLTLSCIRWIGTFLLLLPFAWPYLRKDLPVLRAKLPYMILLSTTGFAINNAVSFW